VKNEKIVISWKPLDHFLIKFVADAY